MPRCRLSYGKIVKVESKTKNGLAHFFVLPRRILSYQKIVQDERFCRQAAVLKNGCGAATLGLTAGGATARARNLRTATTTSPTGFGDAALRFSDKILHRVSDAVFPEDGTQLFHEINFAVVRFLAGNVFHYRIFIHIRTCNGAIRPCPPAEKRELVAVALQPFVGRSLQLTHKICQRYRRG